MPSVDLECFVDELIRRSAEKNYHPTAFQTMRSRYGTISAIVRLVEKSEIQSGLLRLKSLGLLDWSIEAAVLKFPEEFGKTTRDYAQFRFDQAQNDPGLDVGASKMRG